MEKTKMKRKVIMWVIIAVLIIILLAALLVFNHYYTEFNGSLVSRNEEHIRLENTEKFDVSAITRFNSPKTIDLRAVSAGAEDVAFLREKYPDCRILWTVNVCEDLSLENETTAVSLADSRQLAALAAASAHLGLIKDIKVDYPNVSKSDYDALAAAFPEAEIEYSIVINGAEVPLDTVKLDFSAHNYEAFMDAAEHFDLLPMLSEIELTDAEGNSPFSLDEVIAIHEECPKLKLNYSFELFGMQVNTAATERLEYYDTEIGDEGLDTFRKVIPIMHGLKYLRFNNCGTSDDAVAQLREDFPEVKVVWLLTLGKAQFYTDTIRIRANFNFLKEDIWKLKYCVDVKYIDCGHLAQFFDCEWARYMPNLEVCIIAMTAIRDISPLAECKNLEFLEIFTNNIRDLSPLAELENLQYLNISNMPITDISPIMGLDNLKMVNCNMLRSISLDQIAEFRSLHPDTVFNYYYGALPTETGWRTVGYKYSERYALLREQMGYDDRHIAPYGYLPAPLD